ncbi:hypothetical protein K439DRAFT_1613875 [Ramaria rubella]|nr:hypothetical protein K439DRAFT_1613875 [Ramaria rubella]
MALRNTTGAVNVRLRLLTRASRWPRRGVVSTRAAAVSTVGLLLSPCHCGRVLLGLSTAEDGAYNTANVYGATPSPAAVSYAGASLGCRPSNLWSDAPHISRGFIVVPSTFEWVVTVEVLRMIYLTGVVLSCGADVEPARHLKTLIPSRTFQGSGPTEGSRPGGSTTRVRTDKVKLG